MSNVLSIHIDGLRTVSEQNVREHWAVRNRRRKAQKEMIYYAWKKAAFGKRIGDPPYQVRLTRFGPQLFDSDNAVSSFKAIRDCVADLLKVDDGDVSKIQFEYDQRVDASYSVVIQVEGR